ncbi:hypothetical protein [Lactococcus garvieae]
MLHKNLNNDHSIEQFSPIERFNKKQGRTLKDDIEIMFKAESDQIVNEEPDVNHRKFIITLTAIMMSTVILISFIYKMI